nr:ribonuclease H-like domain-containing protein [Tanacetum cinerariifolium]
MFIDDKVSAVKSKFSVINDVTRLQALVDKKKVVVTEAAIREVLQLDDAAGVDCLPNEEIFTELARMGKGFSRVETPLFERMLIGKEIKEKGDAGEHVEDVNAGDDAQGDNTAAHGEVPTVTQEPSIPSPTPTIPPSQLRQDIPLTSQVQQTPPESPQDDAVVLMDEKEEDKKVKEAKVDESAQVQGRQAESQTEIYKIDMDHALKVFSMQEDEPAKVWEVVYVLTTAMLITKAVTAASKIVTAASAIISAIKPQVPTAPARVAAAPARVAAAPNKGKGIMVEEPKPLKKKQHIEMDEEYAIKLHAKLNEAIDWDVAINHVKLKAKKDPATKEKIEEEENIALQSINETPAQKLAKRRKLNEEVEDLKRHLEIVPDEDDDVYTEATALARKVLVVDYKIIELNNKPCYKIIRADGTHQLYISFLTLLKNFDREDLEALWSLVKEMFSTSKPKNFSDDFLLTTLREMFKKPDVQAQVWKNQRTIHGQAKCCQAKLMLLDNAAEARLTLLSHINATKMKEDLIAYQKKSFLNNLDSWDMGKGSTMPSGPQHTPIIQPSTSKPQKKQKTKKSRRQDPEETQPTGPTTNIVDEALNEVNVAAQSNDPPFSRVNTLGNGDDGLKLKELMEICTKLQQRVIDLENTKSVQALEILSLKNKVKRLEKKRRSRTHRVKRLYKVGLSARLESSAEEQSLGKEDAFKQGRNIADIDADGVLNDEEVVVKKAVIVKEVDATQDQVSAATTIVAKDLTVEDITLEKALEVLKTSKPNIRGNVVRDHKEKSKSKTIPTSIADRISPKAKGIVMEEPSKATTTTIPISSKVQDKGKWIMNEETLKMKKKDQINFDVQEARRLCEEEQGELIVEEKSRLFVELMDKRKKHFAKPKAEEKRRNRLTKVQKRNQILKRAGDKLEQECSKKHKIDDDTDTAELKQLLNIIPEEDIAIDAIPLAVKTPVVDWKIYKEGKKIYYQIIRAGRKSKSYLIFSHMLKDFDREDVETLWQLVKANFEFRFHINSKKQRFLLVVLDLIQVSMDSLSTKVVSAAKLPILNPNEFDLWKMRLEQYFLMTDYSLWEVILNGDSHVPTIVVEGVVQPVGHTSREQKLARRDELKAHDTFLMALPDKHQLKFNSHKDAKTLMEAIEKRFGGNTETKKVQRTLLKQQFENITSSSSKSLDQIHDRLQKFVSLLDIHRVSLSQEDVNLKFLRSLPSEWKTHTFIWRNKAIWKNEVLMICSIVLKFMKLDAPASVSAVCAKMHVSSLLNVNFLSNAIDVDDLDEMDLRWQMSMRARRFLQKTGINVGDNRPTYMGFNMSKVECYNCHRKEHFARECRSQPSGGYHDVPPLITRTFMPPKPDLVFHTASIAVETDHSAFTIQLSTSKPAQDLSHTNRPSAPIIKDWVSDSKDESEATTPHNVSSFVQSSKQVKTPRHSVQPVETSILIVTPKPSNLKFNSSGKRRNRKTCFVCKSVDHLIKDYDHHAKKIALPTPRNYEHRGNNKQNASLTHNNTQKHKVPAAVLTQSKLVFNTAVRPVSVVVPKIMVTRPRLAHLTITKSKSPIRRNITRSTSLKTNNSPPRVTVAQAPVGNPQYALKDKGVIDSRCSWHMTGNMSYLSNFEELNGGYVAFGGNTKGGKIFGKRKIKTGKLDFDDVYFVKELKFNLFSVSQMCDKKNSVLFTDTECLVLSPDFKLPDEIQVLLRFPRENNMYNVYLKNIVPSGDLTCLFAKVRIANTAAYDWLELRRNGSRGTWGCMGMFLYGGVQGKGWG